MRQVTVGKIAEQTDISSGNTSLGLVLVRESGSQFFLPIHLAEEDLGALLSFLLTPPREEQYDSSAATHHLQQKAPESFESGGYEPTEYDRPPGEPAIVTEQLPVRDEPSAHSQGYSLEGDDFAGGGGIDQL